MGNSREQLYLFEDMLGTKNFYEVLHPKTTEKPDDVLKQKIKEIAGVFDANLLKPLAELKLEDSDEYKVVNNRFANFYFYHSEIKGLWIDVNEAKLQSQDNPVMLNILEKIERELLKVKRKKTV